VVGTDKNTGLPIFKELTYHYFLLQLQLHHHHHHLVLLLLLLLLLPLLLPKATMIGLSFTKQLLQEMLPPAVSWFKSV
jgi:hypothetical protein